MTDRDDEDKWVERRRASIMEQHFQTLVGFILIGAIGFVGWTTTNSGNRIVALEATFVAQMAAVDRRLEELERKVEASANRSYLASDAARDFDKVWEVITDHEKRIDRMEADHRAQGIDQ